MLKKNVFRLGISLVLISGIFFQSYSFAEDKPLKTISDSNFITSLFEGTTSLNNPDTKKNVEDLIFNFCEKIVETGKRTDGGYVYNPQDSVFLTILCSSVGSADFFDTVGYLKKYDLGSFSYTNDCNAASTDLNDCNLSWHLPDILDNILNDYFNVKQASLYGLQSKDFGVKKLEDQANEFVSQYYLLPDKDGKSSLICGEGTAYTTTCKRVKEYIQKAAKLVAKADVINNDTLLSDLETINKPMENAVDGFTCDFGNNKEATYSLLVCGLHGDKQDPMNSFTNLLYNELMYYRLFMGYYLWNIADHNELLPSGTIGMKQGYVQNYTRTFTTKANQTQKSVSATLRLLTDMYANYPLHIGFMMYHEKLISFRQNIAKIYTPILTLYDKLQNVQDSK